MLVRRLAARVTWPGAKVAALLASLAISAYLAATATEPNAPSWLAWVVLLPLFLAIRTQVPRFAMGCGAFWGVTVYVVSLGLFESSAPFSIVTLALLAIIPAIYGYLCARVMRSLGYCALLLGFAWVGVELLLTPVLHGGFLLTSHGPELLTDVIGGVFGSVAVAFVLAFANALLLSILFDLTFRLPRIRRAVEIRIPHSVALRRTLLLASSPACRNARPRGPPA
jgi:apolipoprotein N-acyltransferase